MLESNCSLSEVEKKIFERTISECKDKFIEVSTGMLLELVIYSATHGNALGQKQMGDFYSNKIEGVIQQNLAEAKKWYMLAARQGNISALKHLLNFHLNGQLPFDEIDVIIRKFQTNESTDCELHFLLGKVYHKMQMYEPAFKYIKISAKNNNREAVMFLADLYFTGCGSVDPDPQKTLKLLNDLKDANYIPALCKLGQLYESGFDGQDKKPNKAYKLYKEAADKGHEDAIRKIKELDKIPKKAKRKKRHDKEDFFDGDGKYLIDIQ
jgi:TPR repeat protein